MTHKSFHIAVLFCIWQLIYACPFNFSEFEFNILFALSVDLLNVAGISNAIPLSGLFIKPANNNNTRNLPFCEHAEYRIETKRKKTFNPDHLFDFSWTRHDYIFRLWFFNTTMPSKDIRTHNLTLVKMSNPAIKIFCFFPLYTYLFCET